MTPEQITQLEQCAETLEDVSRQVLALTMGARPFTYDAFAIEYIYRILDKGVSFERLVQVLTAHETARKEIKVAA